MENTLTENVLFSICRNANISATSINPDPDKRYNYIIVLKGMVITITISINVFKKLVKFSDLILLNLQLVIIFFMYCHLGQSRVYFGIAGSHYKLNGNHSVPARKDVDSEYP
jgi:hypothetical protein